MMEHVSIVIPTLNEEKQVGSLLECLSRQSYKNFEVIIVDGDSKDNTKKIAKRYQGKLNLNIINSKRRNIAYQRNLGAKKARYDLLCFMDADIIIKPDFLKDSIRSLKKVDIAVPRYIPLDKRWYYRVFFAAINLIFKLTEKIKPCGIGMCIFSNKKVHEKVDGFDESYGWTDDIDYLRKSSHFRYKRLNEKIFFSVRRFEKEGTKSTMKKWLKCYWYFLKNSLHKTKDMRYL